MSNDHDLKLLAETIYECVKRGRTGQAVHHLREFRRRETKADHVPNNTLTEEQEREVRLNGFCWDIAYLTQECGMDEFKAIGLLQDLQKAMNKQREELLDWVEAELIGEDEHLGHFPDREFPRKDGYTLARAKNNLREQQRTKLERKRGE